MRKQYWAGFVCVMHYGGWKTTVTLCLREPGVIIFQGTGELTCCLESQMCLLATEDKSECVSHLDLAEDEV